MSILFKSGLFLLSVLSFAAFLLPGKILAMQEEEKEDIIIHKNPNKENGKKEENKTKSNDFLNRIKSLPKESLEKKKDAKLSPEVRNRENKFWVNEKGERVLIESN